MSKDLYEQLSNIEQQAKLTFEGLSEMKAVLAAVLEKNAELKIENKHLREHLQELGQPTTPKAGAQALSKSKQNLQNLYEEGFHICPYFYGSRRENNEPCAFCNDVIYGERTND
ncbi:DNA replication initiation control protein YabA [Latilactobacillus graminis]|uniref:Initiation-control protein YabA n=2 Tax=Latilactobacillus graminis TaxID=60519 RepID=A0AA89I2J1_9LACO|nr:DNA replication initiation control protein YabA [Latilactobacillus graminis]KRM24539.1 hypothetical protein FC90_GL000244 [Latilactobacillus graminis DSM 20719]QFP79007.1 DNA replication initiation control protein YabA [Latilactobacillus graminis]